MNKEDIIEISELIAKSEEFRPIVKQAILAIKSYGPELKDLFEVILHGTVDLKIKCIKQFEEEGFSREEAILLTNDTWSRIKQSIEMNRKK